MAKSPHILVIEDDPGVVALETEVLEALGARVEHIRDGRAAVKRLKAITPTLLLLDYSLPDMTGLDLIELLRHQDIPIPPFVVATGGGDERVAVALMKHGARDYLVKDAHFLDVLPAVIQRVLNEIDIARRLAEAEHEVMWQVDRYHALLNTTPDGFLIVDREGRCVDANRAFCQMTGYPYEELIGRPMTQLKPIGGEAEPAKMIARAIREGALRAETQCITCGGRQIDVEISASYHPDHGMIGFVRDITDRKRTEAELARYRLHLEERVAERTAELERSKNRLEEAEFKYRTVADHTYDWESWTGPDGSFLYCSPSCERITGYPAEAFMNDDHRLLDIVYPEDRPKVEDHFQNHFDSPRLQGLEFRICHRNGQIRHLEHLCLPVRDEQGRFLGRRASTRDISVRKQAECEIRKARDAAEAANRAKTVFLANMSHELRTPLNAILGFAQLMLRDAGVENGYRRELETIDRSGRHLLALINDVLEISRIEAGRTQVRREPYDLFQVIQDVASIAQVRAESKGLALEVKTKRSLPQYVLGDAHHLRQVLLNLLGNAVKFTDQGRVRLRVAPRKGRLYFEVRDSGPGIPEEERQQVFEAFYQTQTGVDLGEGTGLGLTIASEFVRLMEGRLGVTEAPSGGSLFSFSLPLMLAQPPVGKPSPERIRGLEPGQSCRILVAEDQGDNRQWLTRLLESIGCEVRSARHGEEAVAMFQSWIPDLIWMDLRMPVLDGYAATRRIRALPGGKKVRIVALTASVFEEERAQVLAAGCDDMLPKPIDEDQLFAVMGQLLGLRYRRQADPEPAVAEPLKAASGLAGLPEDTRAALRTAALNLDLEAASAVVAGLGLEQAAVAQLLRTCLETFQFERVVMLCDLEEEAPPPP